MRKKKKGDENNYENHNPWEREGENFTYYLNFTVNLFFFSLRIFTSPKQLGLGGWGLWDYVLDN